MFSATEIQTLYSMLSQAAPKLAAPLQLSIGIEVEGQIPLTLDRSRVADRIATSLRAQHPQRKVKVICFESPKNDPVPTSYDIVFEDDAKALGWQVKSDSSFQGDDGFTDLEIASPVINTESEKESFYRILTELEALGMEALPDRAGVHIHYGWPEPEPFSIAVLRLLLGELESELLDFFSVSKNRRHALGAGSREQENRLKILQCFTEAQDTAEDLKNRIAPLLQDLLTPESSFNKKGGWVNFSHYKTLEIRVLNSTLKPNQIESCQRFFNKLISSVLTKDKTLLDSIKCERSLNLSSVSENIGFDPS